MTYKTAYEIMGIELQCVQRNIDGECDRQCENCDLVQKDTDLIEAYITVQVALKKIMDLVGE